MTHEHTANEEAHHGNRDGLEAMTRERDRLREALRNIDAMDLGDQLNGCSETVLRSFIRRSGEIARAALEDKQ